MPSIGQEATSSAVGDREGVLERSGQLAALDGSLDSVIAESTGRLVLVGGEAGAGKTTLLRTFCDRQRDSERILWGACEGLLTPGPLAPFFDLAEDVGGELEELVRSEARPHEVVAALTGELDRRSPAILVLEDLHWADEATLDVVRLLGRRLERVGALVLASYRDDEVDHTHPLQVVLGVLAAEPTTDRVEVRPLSAPAVAELAAPHGMDGDALYRETNGNPFFVNEVLAAGTEEIPHTVRDAVLARTAHLTAPARALVEAIAIVPTQAEVWLLEALADGPVDRLDECLSTGVLTSTRDRVAFRHELARLTIEATLPPDRRVDLHRKALDALTAHPNATRDLARLAHHAEAAGDGDAVLQFAPEAAARAASLGAHREAAAQYARALRFADPRPVRERADLLERCSSELHMTDQVDGAIDALESALELHRQLGDRIREGDALRSLSGLLWCPGRVAEAEDANRKAVTLLERLPPGRELALAYSQASSLAGDAEDIESTISWGSRATELAERLDDAEVLLDASTNVAGAELVTGLPGGRETLERNYELAKRSGLDDQAGKAIVNLAWAEGRRRNHRATEPALDAGLEHCSEHGLELWRLYLLALRARSRLDQGRWAEAVASADVVLREPRASTLPRIFALVVSGLVRARRGDPEQWAPLDEALPLAEMSGELGRLGPVAAARAEVAWLGGDPQAAVEATEVAYELARKRRSQWMVGELACWRRRARADAEADGPADPADAAEAAEPYRLELTGEWAAAAEAWDGLGCPYESALALAGADDADALRSSLDELHRLGASETAAVVARRLRERGVRGLPRGPRATTRDNPAGLTAREVEVLGLVARGHRNADIAERLFVSTKTVGHHVSAILRKLDVRTRAEASAEAVRLGLADPS